MFELKYLFKAVSLPKKAIRLYVGTRKQGSGSYIASVPLLKLKKLSECPDRYKHWRFEQGWLILEAY